MDELKEMEAVLGGVSVKPAGYSARKQGSRATKKAAARAKAKAAGKTARMRKNQNLGRLRVGGGNVRG